MKILYRYEIEYSNIDDSSTYVKLREYQVIKETDQSYFINHLYRHSVSNYTKRVSKRALNTFAYDNKKDALNHFVRRTRKRVAWYKYWIDQCEKALEIVENGEI